MSNKYPPSLNAVDIVCFAIDWEEKALKVLLLKRDVTPQKNKWALPGGFVNEKPDEKAAKQFTAMAEPEAEGAIRSTEDSYRRKTFNLHQALLDEEQDWVHRKADKITKPSDIFSVSKSGLFRIKKKPNNKRRRL